MENAGAPGRAPRRGATVLARFVGSIGLLFAVVAPAGTARAAEPVAPPPAHGSATEPVNDATASMRVSDRPWAVGVSPAQQEAALKHLQEGNSLLKESLFVAAAKVYRQALTEWDHPGIHYNLALALLNMDQPVEVFQHLQAAIKYGAEPLDPEKLEHAKSYLRLIEKQVASVDIRCDIDGAQVTFDGALLFRAPGSYQGLVRAGTHTVTASKEGFNTTSRTEEMTYDKRTTLNLRLYTSGDLIGYKRRYPIWRPIAVAAFGGVLLATGAVFTLQAKKNFDSFDTSAMQVCPAGGCATTDPNYPSLNNLRNTGNTYKTLAAISYVAGGTIAAAGVLLLVMDRSIPYRVDPETDRRDVASLRPLVSPFFSPGLAGLAATGRF